MVDQGRLPGGGVMRVNPGERTRIWTDGAEAWVGVLSVCVRGHHVSGRQADRGTRRGRELTPTVPGGASGRGRCRGAHPARRARPVRDEVWAVITGPEHRAKPSG